MQKLQNSIFSIIKTTSLSPAVFSFLQPSADCTDEIPLGGILRDTNYGWLALGPKFCIVDLRSGLKIAARNFGYYGLSSRISITSVVELPTPLTENSQQLIISLECDDTTGMICVFHINGSQLLRCIQTDVVISKLAVCDTVPSGSFMCFDGLVMAGTRKGEIFVFDLNRTSLVQALKHISQGYEHLIQGEANAASLIFLPLKAMHKIEGQRELAFENNDHLAILLNETSFLDGQYIFWNPDGTVRMKAKRNHIRVTVIEYIPQLGTLAVGFNFGAFQLWNLLNLELEFTSQVNVECLPVTHFGFQEPCDDPRAFCYLWVVFSVTDRLEEEEFPLAVMYSLTYQGKRMLSDTDCVYQDFSNATIRFQIELSSAEDGSHLIGGRCISCNTYSINSTLGEEGEDTMLNLCQLVWECWGEHINTTLQHGMLLFDLDQWYKDQMPATYNLESNTFMSAAVCPELGRGVSTLDVKLSPTSVSPYSHATRLEEHFYPNSLQYSCVYLNTSEALMLQTVGIQREIIKSMWEVGPSCLLRPQRLHSTCVAAGLTPLYGDPRIDVSVDDQRRYLLSVALEARLSRFLKRCAHEWATGTHSGVGCTLTFLVDWCWRRAVELKENAKELTAPLFTSSTLPDRNVIRCLEQCVHQLGQLTGLLDSILTKCCNLVVPDALSELEERARGVGAVCAYFQVAQWLVRGGLLPERARPLAYPALQLDTIYRKRRIKLHCLQDKSPDEEVANKSCDLLYIDQLIEHEFGGERVRSIWLQGGSTSGGLYPPPSLAALLRLYLLPDIPDEHKHSLLLYLLLDYSVLYDDIRYEAVIRRLMQFPTMFGLSNTAIKATQAFWHLDHRDFDFALDQLQCLTGNTLSDWQHKVVLSALLAQKKTQAALQYLHVRKPAPIQSVKDEDCSNNKVNDHDKLEDWQSCTDLYLARGLVFEALDVVRMCVSNAATSEEKMEVLNFFFKGCRNTGQLSKVLQVSLLPFEEEVFIKYLRDCKEPQTTDILLMYFLQQARYLEAEKEVSRGGGGAASGALVAVACAALPRIATAVASCAAHFEPHIIAPTPLSVYVQATSPKNTFTYKSSFIQDTIENASETWINKPKTRKGIKRALAIEETPFICTPKLSRTRSILGAEKTNESSPAKRPKMEMPSTPKTPKIKVSEQLSRQMSELLDMPEIHTPNYNHYEERSGADTPQSILKLARAGRGASPAGSGVAADSDDELDSVSTHTHCSDSTNKHLRFTIPAASETESTPSPVARHTQKTNEDEDIKNEMNTFNDEKSHRMNEPSPLESPPKKFAADESLRPRKSYKDSVRGRISLSISANSSLSDDPNTSVESIADISVTLLNPRHPRHRPSRKDDAENLADKSGDDREQTNADIEPRKLPTPDAEIIKQGEKATETIKPEVMETSVDVLVPKTPKGRRSIRTVGESTPLVNRARSVTPERLGSPIVTPLQIERTSRSKSRSPLAVIPERPALELPQPPPPPLHVPTPTPTRSRSRTPERKDKSFKESPRLEAIIESPTKQSESPTRRSLRSRSRTPEVEVPCEPQNPPSPRSLRARSKTPEKLMSPKKDPSRNKKSLSRIVLEANTFAKSKNQSEKMETEADEEKDSAIECTPMKSLKQIPSLMDVTFSPIINKSVLQSSTESVTSITVEKNKTENESDMSALKQLPTFTSISEIDIGKSVLCSYQSSIVETSSVVIEEKIESIAPREIKTPADFTLGEDFGKSVLKSCESSVAESRDIEKIETPPPSKEVEVKSFNETDFEFGKSVLRSYESSVVETNESCKDKGNLGESVKNNSSLMTSDSDMDVSEKKIENQDKSVNIQKEKERIVEIEREINEMEEEMEENKCREIETDEESVNESVSVESANNDDESMESDSSGETENEVISINDSDESSNSTDKLIIVTGPSEPPQVTEKETPGIAQAQDENSKDMAIETSENTDPLNQANISILTDDNSVVESEKSLNLNYSNENKQAQHKEETKDEAMEQKKEEDHIPLEDENNVEKPDKNKQMDIVIEEINPSMETNKEAIPVGKEIDVVDAGASAQDKKGVEFTVQEKMDIEDENKIQDTTKLMARKTIESDNTSAPLLQENINDESIIEKKSKEDTKTVEEETHEAPLKKAPSRKRTKSTSVQAKEIEQTEEPKTPITRKRSQSITSNTSETEQKTPEDNKNVEVSTPTTRRRSKTPTSTEVRKILTRRASKEMSEKTEEDNVSLDEVLTPRRRSTRSRSKKDDDSISIASESSTKSNRSKTSEDTEGKVQIRKGRKSILNTKTDLSVIPEVTVEESKGDTNEDLINELSTRRLTRNQKLVLETWLEPRSPQPRRRSAASKTSEPDDDDASSVHSDASSMDRLTLLNKTDYEGLPDPDEVFSPNSSTSNSKPRPRLSRAASETKVTPKQIKMTRRISADVALSPESGSGRRRASFTRACQALHTPTKKLAADQKVESESEVSSPASSAAGPSTPARRPRRASTQSNSSAGDDKTRTKKGVKKPEE